MTHAIQNSSDQRTRFLHGMKVGAELMMLQTPLVTALNRVSVVSGYKNVSGWKAAQNIYLGTIDQKTNASVFHFLRGGGWHLAKEGCRLGSKTYGLMEKSSLNDRFKEKPLGWLKADLIFASSLSVWEMFINPVDTVKTMRQAGEKIGDIPKGQRLSHLYKGSTANGCKQFGIWMLYPLSNRICDGAIEGTTSVNPHELTGIFLKAIPQATIVTAPVWIFERLKNELQYDLKAQYAQFRYAHVFQKVMKEQGTIGLLRGFGPKIASNTVLVLGANYVYELGAKGKRV